jgi:mRNA interferase MazF
MSDAELERGSVWLVALDPVVGRELRKTRPCVIVQTDAANRKSPVTIVCPLVSARGREGNILNVQVPVGDGGVLKESLVQCNQVRVVDRSRLRGKALGTLSSDVMTRVNDGLRTILDLD